MSPLVLKRFQLTTIDNLPANPTPMESTMSPLVLNEMQLPITWGWLLRCAMINLAVWLLVFGTLLLLAYYMQEGAILYIEQ